MADNSRSGNRNDRNKDQRTQGPGRQDMEQQRGSGRGMDEDVSYNQEGYQRSRSDNDSEGRDSGRSESGRSDRADRDQSL